uniref:VWFD domain-containing protein n=1 Tax=Paramormyrops kingsleyae TaxID=1676925 RepID=A0A3B3QH44_9TELE
MKGKACGVCGKADGEVKQEFRTPNGRLASSAVSFSHSWVVPAKSCRDAEQCFMKTESIQLEKQINLNGQESKCYSVEPVLQCLPGCNPLKTTPVTVGFHCLPIGIFWEKTVDLKENTEAHVACHCTHQCA